MIKRNLYIFKLYYFFWRFKPLAALMIIYFTQITKSYSSAMGIFAIFNISYAFAKIPSGLISDKLGRKPVLIAANIITSSAFILLSLAGQFEIKYFLYLFAFMWGTGEALSAGTVDALMYETATNLKQSNYFKSIYAKSMYYEQLGCALGAICAMFVTYSLPLQFVAWISILPPLTLLIVACFFVEPKIKRKNTTINKNDIITASKQFIKNKTLTFYTLSDIYFSTLGDISHRFESAYFKLFTSDWIISLAKVLKHLFGMLGFAFVPFIKYLSNSKIYFGSISCNILIRTIAVIANNIYTPFIHMFINFFYATASTARTDILQHEFLPQYRATTQSIIQFIKGLYMSTITYLLGIVADLYGIYVAMLSLIVLRIIGLCIVHTVQHFYKI